MCFYVLYSIYVVVVVSKPTPTQTNIVVMLVYSLPLFKYIRYFISHKEIITYLHRVMYIQMYIINDEETN